ncbi:MAG: DUF1653 domain-containing protein [Pseudomonadota bacterium]
MKQDEPNGPSGPNGPNLPAMLGQIKQIAPGVYRHYKGKNYFVLGLTKNTETAEVCVVYRPLYDTDWAHLMHRNADMFMEQVLLDGQLTPRFQLVKD